MLKTVNWRKLGYPKHPIPKPTPGYDKLVWEWYRDQGFAVPNNSAEYRALLAGKPIHERLHKYRPNQHKPDDIPKSTPGYSKVRRAFKQNDDLFPILDNKKHYVYEYFRPDHNTCFYVGCGKGSRGTNIHGRTKEFKAILDILSSKGLEPILGFFAVGLTWPEALELENERIAHYIVNGSTSLVNRMFRIGGVTYLKNSEDMWEVDPLSSSTKR